MHKLISIHKMGFRLLKMIQKEDSLIIPMHLLEVCLSLAQVYAGLFLTAGMIDALPVCNFPQAARQFRNCSSSPFTSQTPSSCSS